MSRNHSWFHTSELYGDTNVVTCGERSVEAAWMYLVYIRTLTIVCSGGTPLRIIVRQYLRKGSVMSCAFLVLFIVKRLRNICLCEGTCRGRHMPGACGKHK